MYVGTTDGIIISPFGALWEEQYLLPGEDIYRIYEDSKHNLWIGTRMNGLYRRVNDRIEKIPLCPNCIFRRIPGSAFPVISVQSPVSIQCCWQS